MFALCKFKANHGIWYFCYEKSVILPETLVYNFPGFSWFCGTVLEHFQASHIHNFSGEPITVPRHPHGKAFLPNIKSKPINFQFETIPYFPVTAGSL